MGWLVLIVLLGGGGYLLWTGMLLTVLAAGLAMLAGSLAMGTLGFWALMLVLSGVIFYCDEEENGVGATVAALTALVLLQFFGDLQVFTFLWEHPLTALAVVGGYLLLGAVWSVARLALYVKERRNAYDDRRDGWLKHHNVTEESITTDLKIKWTDLVKKESLTKPDPTSRENVYRLTRWMMYWPWSILWWVIDDFVKRVFEEIRRALKSAYRRVTDAIWGNRDTHIATEEELQAYYQQKNRR